MQELFTHLDQLRVSEPRAAMATLIATRGTTPKKEGAKMWVGEGGRVLGSVTIGGCADARIISESEDVLASGRMVRASIDIGDDDAFDLGLTCGGTIEVLIEPVELRAAEDPILNAYDRVRAGIASGEGAAVAIALSKRGPARRVVINASGERTGTLGDPTLDAQAVTEALAALRRGRSALVDAGRATQLFIEVHGAPDTLVLFGAGQIAADLARMASLLGWRVIVADGRERFATRERFPLADEIHVGRLDEIASRFVYGPGTSVVLVAHDYKFDIPALRVVLNRAPAYIGLLGSRKRGAALREFLAGEGFEPAALDRIHVPIGLDLGAASSMEIALSVLAEALAVRRGRPGTPLRDRVPRIDTARSEVRS